MTTKTAVRRIPPPPPPPARRRPPKVVLYAAATLIALFLAGWVGWLLNDANQPTYGVRVQGTYSATVAQLNGGKTAGCVTTDSFQRICSAFLQDAGAPALRVGQHVTVAHVWMDDAHGSQDGLLIYP